MSRRLPSLRPAAVIRVLERNGFYLKRHGKHRFYTDGIHVVPVPFHNRDLPRGTLMAIIDQAGWTVEEFLEKL